MANNRMVLVCSICSPEGWQYKSPGVFVLAKYYPNTGYYPTRGTDEMSKWFDEHRHAVNLGYPDPFTKEEATAGPDCLFRLEYECPDGNDGSGLFKTIAAKIKGAEDHG